MKTPRRESSGNRPPAAGEGSNGVGRSSGGAGAVALWAAVLVGVVAAGFALLGGRTTVSPSGGAVAGAGVRAGETSGVLAGAGVPAAGGEVPARELTYHRDIAPLVYRHCSPCHRPGEPGPFSLLTYGDVKKHLPDILEVTRRRFMPPWLPDGVPAFEGERRLSDPEIRRLADWAAHGAAEGRVSDAPPMPRWTEGWQLGPPDVVVTLPEPFVVPADGPDVYRNFVVPVPTTRRRYVRAFEFRPGSRAVHHAFLRIDGSGEARRLDAREAGPGFGGMDIPPSAESPSGHFLSWQPGRMPTQVPDGLSWVLPAGADVVLLMHMQPIGRPETLRPSIGFYFTDVAPTNTPMKIGLRCYTLDLPAGATNTVVEEQVVLPVDTVLHAVLPHAHYLGRRIEGYALLPDGRRQPLLTIPQWDFNWQSEFRFVTPVALPRGTTVGMRFSYDNSDGNPRNPNRPPRRVTFGLQTTDEMAELWLQLIAPNPADFEALAMAAQSRTVRDIEELSRFQLRADPGNAEATIELGKVRLAKRELGEAEQLFRKALRLKPGLDDAWYHLGLVSLENRRLPEAEIAFLKALGLNPGHYQARNNAGLCCLRQRRFEEAAAHFREVLRLHPDDPMARENLKLVERASRGAAKSR